ncbi:phage T7 F exclusion suppressor FxsA [Pseudobythopirellula maris]|uniref:Phage T7 F exclusion suppressor FxsA n=1 Tax=Pseudobythopirellula maris TaxID=2527991 RepID=A0A5C5ZQC2_9BACT|nr:FxsA family protein [Pseudobythopirellula maris]TWT89021.1 phage T7 F exclusion suppressor FxsA [Pseudobythopirellula maris]
MFFYLLLLFTVVPLVEFSLLWEITERTNLLFTIALVLATGALGAALARWQGLVTLWKIRERAAGGGMPTDELFDGALILVAGAVLITPGVLTDAFGFALLTPPLRALVKRGLKAWFKRNVKFHVHTTAPGGAPSTPRGSEVLDVEVIDVRPAPRDETS